MWNLFACLLLAQAIFAAHHEPSDIGDPSKFFGVAPPQSQSFRQPPPVQFPLQPPMQFPPPMMQQPPPPMMQQPPPMMQQPPPMMQQPPPMQQQPPPPMQQQPPPMQQQPQPVPSQPGQTAPCQPGEIRLGPNAVTYRFNNKMYWLSSSERSNAQMNWANAEKSCRDKCMTLVSLDTPGETDFIGAIISQTDIYGVWTSGRQCNFAGCEKDPKYQNAWVWGTKGTLIGSDPNGKWSTKGGLGMPQPDNMIGMSGGEREECIALLSNWYEDGSKVFHDMPCSELLPYVCEQN